MNPEEKLTTDQAGKILRITSQRVRQLIEAGRLPASRFGKSHVIRRGDLARVKNRPPGRPRKK